MLNEERIDLARLRNGSDESPDRARWHLADRVSRALSRPESVLRPPADRVLRVSVPVDRVNPFGWLRGNGLFPKLYWTGRDGASAIAAVGAADVQEDAVLDGPDELRKRLSPLLVGADTLTRYYGGLRFDPRRKPDEGWSAFGAYRFVLPRFELHVDGGGDAMLVCNLVLPRDAERREEILEQVEGLAFPRGGPDAGQPPPDSRTDVPGFTGWERGVERALEAFREGRLNKAVLARRADLGFAEEVDATSVLEELGSATPGCFHFFVEPEDGMAFVGASPERLFRREGRRVESEAVAGTRPRGVSEADDDGLREELLRSEKDRSELEYVRVGVREVLGALCDELEVEQDVLEMKGASRRHLVSRVRGRLREGVTDADVLLALNPTPAVGGYPRGEMLDEILAQEPFDRGWYAGSVGWIGAEASEFAVGIRSALIRGRTVSLFSGAGIVPGSVPAQEWDEIEQKIEDFKGMFGRGPGQSPAKPRALEE